MYWLFDFIAEYLVIFFCILLFHSSINPKKRSMIACGFLFFICLFSGISFVNSHYQQGIGYYLFIVSLVFFFLIGILTLYSFLNKKKSPSVMVFIKKEEYELGTVTHPDVLLAVEGGVIHAALWKHKDKDGNYKEQQILFLNQYPLEPVDIQAALQYNEQEDYYICSYFKKVKAERTKKEKQEIFHNVVLYLSVFILPILITYCEVNAKALPLQEGSLFSTLFGLNIGIIVFGLARKLFRSPKDSLAKVIYWLEIIGYYAVLCAYVFMLIKFLLGLL